MIEIVSWFLNDNLSLNSKVVYNLYYSGFSFLFISYFISKIIFIWKNNIKYVYKYHIDELISFWFSSHRIYLTSFWIFRLISLICGIKIIFIPQIFFHVIDIKNKHHNTKNKQSRNPKRYLKHIINFSFHFLDFFFFELQLSLAHLSSHSLIKRFQLLILFL